MKIKAYGSYYMKFMSRLSELEKGKTQRALLLLETEDRVPYHYIKYLTDGIFEFRVSCGRNESRLLFIYDGKDVIVLLNCFRKKTRKTPVGEIHKAMKLKREYYEEKNNL